MQGADDNIIPVDDKCDFNTSPLQLAAMKMLQLSKTCANQEAVRLHKEMRGHNLARGEIAVAVLRIGEDVPTSR